LVCAVALLVQRKCRVCSSQGGNVGGQHPDAVIIQFPRSGKYPESAFEGWIFGQFTAEEIKGFILHQFDPNYFVNQNRFLRFVKLCKLVDIEKAHKEKSQQFVENRKKCVSESPPVADHDLLKYNEPFVAVSLFRQDRKDK
jgi:hypothetical protein